MALTHTPSLARARERPSFWQHVVRRLQRWALISLFLVWVFAVVELSERVPRPVAASTGAPTLLLVFPLVVLGYYVTIAVHEAGHVLAGALAGYRFSLAMAGPFRLVREANRLRLSVESDRVLHFSGWTFSLPPPRGDWWWRRLLFVAGGPAATLLQVTLGYGLLFALRGKTINFWLENVLSSFTFLGLFILPFTIVPLRFAGVRNDAASLLFHLRGGERLERQRLLHYLVAASVSGTRPRDLEAAWLARARQPADGTDEELSASWLSYFHALDEGDVAAAGRFLDRVLAILETRPPPQRQAIFYLEAAFFEARHGDPAVARAWLDGVPPRDPTYPFAVEFHQAYLRAAAAVLLTEGKASAAAAHARHSLSLLARVFDRGGAVAGAEWLNAMLAEAAAGGATDEVDGWRPPGQKRAPWVRALLRLFLFMVASLLVAVLFILLRVLLAGG